MAKLTAELLAVLRCPVTRTPLVQEGDELVSTGPGATFRYRLDEGIPVLLPQQESSPAPADGTDTTN